MGLVWVLVVIPRVLPVLTSLTIHVDELSPVVWLLCSRVLVQLQCRLGSRKLQV